MFRWATWWRRFRNRDRPLDGGLILDHVVLLDGRPYWHAADWVIDRVIRLRDPSRRWKRCAFVSTDAVQHSPPEGMSPREWLELSFKDREKADRIGTTTIVNDGWDHEHCEICGWTITDQTWGDDPGQWSSGGPGHEIGYHDLDSDWLCERCFRAFIKPKIIPQVTEEEAKRMSEVEPGSPD